MQGLENLGSTCAINSLIQIICRTKDLRNVLLEHNVPPNTLSSELKEIIDMMHNKNHSLSPKKFINGVYRFLEGIFRRGEQIDIAELWMFLYNKMAEELGIPINSPTKHHVLKNIDDINIADTISFANSKELAIHCESVIQNMNSYKASLWQDTSQGIFLSIIQCKKCSKCIYNFEPFINISLDFCDTNEIESLATMFRNYLKTQCYECGDWKCEHCNEKTPYTKSLKIWKLPKVYIFTINRFGNARQKNTKPLNINKTICVKKGSVVTNLQEDITYTATSFGLHYGNLFGGHYCALCKVDDDFVFYDDLNISKISKENEKKIYEKNRDAYMIVYSL